MSDERPGNRSEVLEPFEDFVRRHVGPSDEEQEGMLKVLGYETLDALVDAAVPGSVRSLGTLDLPPAVSEHQVLGELRRLAASNTIAEPMIGLGYSGTVTPGVIRRNVLESPAWYTAYTPYQPEISQGRLEALLNFQTMVSDLTGLDTANASLLDESTAVAEAVTLMRRRATNESNRVIVDADCLPQTIAVLATRLGPLGMTLDVVDLGAGAPAGDYFGMVQQYPGCSGALRDFEALTADAHAKGALVTVATDLLALTLLKPPGEWGADVAVGSSQRFGVPLWYGGPHAAFMAVKSGLERDLPGRLVGLSIDAGGPPGLPAGPADTRAAHPPGEGDLQHLHRPGAAGRRGLHVRRVPRRGGTARHCPPRPPPRRSTWPPGSSGRACPSPIGNSSTRVLVEASGRAAAIVADAAARGVLLRLVDDDHVGISCGETTTAAHVAAVLQAFGADGGGTSPGSALPDALLRRGPILGHPVFSEHHSETAMLRYLRRLSDQDFALDRGMIPLGSCTMKLNTTTEMEPVGLPGFADIHPFAPLESTPGYLSLIDELEEWLARVTGYAKVSVQPNAGSQGELAGLLAIRAYHQSRGEQGRDVCLIPSSAHGTNAASAVMAGMRVVVVSALG